MHQSLAIINEIQAPECFNYFENLNKMHCKQINIATKIKLSMIISDGSFQRTIHLIG